MKISESVSCQVNHVITNLLEINFFVCSYHLIENVMENKSATNFGLCKSEIIWHLLRVLSDSIYRYRNLSQYGRISYTPF